MRKLLISLFAVFSITTYSQINLESILEGGVGDAQNLLQGYLSPVAKGFGNGINGGWYTTAKPHKLFGIDIAVIANAAIVPTEDETFTFNNADFTNIKLDDTSLSSAQIPTIFGSQELADRPLLEFTSNGISISASALPGSGIDIPVFGNAVPSAMVQAGVGLFLKTDLIVRFIPTQKSEGEYEFSTFGFGFKHNIKQWIPFLKRLPFDMSVFAGWNDVKSKVFLDSDNNPTQALELNTKTAIYQLLVSKKLAIFTLYGGIGTTSYDTDINILGTFNTVSSGQTFTDPIQLAYTGSSTRANIGLSMKLFFLNIAAEYAKQEYNVFTVRAGFSIR